MKKSGHVKNVSKKKVLNYIHRFRHSPDLPKDERVSVKGIAKALHADLNKLIELIDTLEDKGFLSSVYDGRRIYCKITESGIREVADSVMKTIRGEFSTKKIGAQIERTKLV